MTVKAFKEVKGAEIPVPLPFRMMIPPSTSGMAVLALQDNWSSPDHIILFQMAGAPLAD